MVRRRRGRWHCADSARCARLRAVVPVNPVDTTTGSGATGRESAGGSPTENGPAQQRATDSPTSKTVAATELAAVDLWRSMVADTAELDFTELAQLLRDRPRPTQRALDAAADEAGQPNGPHRVPAWASALLESVVATERLVGHFQARAAADLAELAGSYPGLREHLSMEIALALGCFEGTATRRLDEAEQTARRLPGTVSARWRGELPVSKVTAMRVETENVSDEVAARVEADVLPAAGRQTVPELRAAIRVAILRRDHDGASTRHRSALARRRLSRWSLPEGMAALQVISSATDIAAIHDCVAAVADLARTPGDARITDQRRVDALADICADVLESGRFAGHELPRRHRRRPQVQVTMPLDALLGSNSPCELRGYGPITAGQARAIAADGELRRLVCDPLSGTLLDYGRSTYQPPQQLANHVLARDAMCTAPGCRQPAARCEVDHTVPYPRGATTADNLAVLCKHHHRAKDGGGFTVRRLPDGSSTWTTPMGNTVTTVPHRLWHTRCSEQGEGSGPIDDTDHPPSAMPQTPTTQTPTTRTDHRVLPPTGDVDPPPF